MTIREIAALAQVSPATVSLVLNGKSGVGAKTRKKIQNIVNQFGYSPKSRDRTAGKKNIRFIKYKKEGLLVERNGDFISRVIDGIEDSARSSGLNFNITNVTSLNFEEMLDSINREHDDGIIFLGTEFLSSDADLLKRLESPVVVVDNEMRNQDIDAVVMNNENAVYTAVSYLKKLGHRHIGHIRSQCVTDNFIARERGYQLAMKELGLCVSEDDNLTVIPDLEQSYSNMLGHVENRSEFPTAYFADNDILAVGALRALKQIGKAVPDEISIIGMDDLILANVSDPPLTTLKIYKKLMGQLAVARLLQKMSEKDQSVQKVLVSAELIVRNSTSTFSPVK